MHMKLVLFKLLLLPVIHHFRVAEVDYVKPEQMQSMEFGFRGKLSRTFTIDAAVYRNDFRTSLIPK